MLEIGRLLKFAGPVLVASAGILLLRPGFSSAQSARSPSHFPTYALVGIKNEEFVLNKYEDEKTTALTAYGVQLAVSKYARQGWHLHSVLPQVESEIKVGYSNNYGVEHTSYIVILEK